MAGVKYEAHYHITSVDPPELTRFIREQHKDVIQDRPRYSMRQLIIKLGFPPTAQCRYCCRELKEVNGIGRVTMTGTRWAESVRRKHSHGTVSIVGDTESLSVAEGSDAEYHLNQRGDIVMNMDNDASRRTVELCYRTNKTLVNPIIDWTDEEVWEFIHAENIPYCSLYDEGWARIGCIGCPLAGEAHQRKQFKRWPHMERMYLQAFDDMLKARRAAGKDCGEWRTGEDVMEWWLRDRVRNKPIEEQLTIGDL